MVSVFATSYIVLCTSVNKTIFIIIIIIVIIIVMKSGAPLLGVAKSIYYTYLGNVQSSKTKMVWPHSEHLGQNEIFQCFLRHLQHRQIFQAQWGQEVGKQDWNLFYEVAARVEQGLSFFPYQGCIVFLHTSLLTNQLRTLFKEFCIGSHLWKDTFPELFLLWR